MGRLGERLDGVREKVERRSVRDRESRRVIGRRLRMLGGLMGFLTMVFCILSMTRQWRRNESLMRDEFVPSFDQKGRMSEEGGCQEGPQQRRERQMDDEGLKLGAKARVSLMETLARSSSVEADATLRLFDEL